MTQQALRTEDIVECLDEKIHTSQDVSSLDIVSGDVYSTVLAKIEAQISSVAQKISFNRTLTSPSDLNPVVLKDDISTYYKQDDVGDFRDAVNDLSELPSTGVLNDLIPVLSENAVYRWDGSSWIAFIKTGTIDHTQLVNQNADINYTHMTLAELALILAQNHTHSNLAILDAIISKGSGLIISEQERNRLPSQDEKNALESATLPSPLPPSSTNRYVTSLDPRLNTVKNPYVTFGPLGSDATYQGDTVVELRNALTHLKESGDVDFVHALEILPATYTVDIIDYLGLVWSDSNPLLMEALALHDSILQIAPEPAGSTAFEISGSGGDVTIRGLTFDLGGINTLGLLIDRNNTIIEDCIFTSSVVDGIKGIKVLANNVSIKRCLFNGTIIQGIEVVGDNCFIENCDFDLSNQTYDGILVSANRCHITSCTLTKGTFEVSPFVLDTIFDQNIIKFTTSFIDAGINTRWLRSSSPDFQQAYIGRTRTVGTLDSYADFRGTTETPFNAALTDPYTTEIEVFEGNYTFSSQVDVPSGRSIKGRKKRAIYIDGDDCFNLASFTKLLNLNITSTISGVFSNSSSNIEIKNCIFTMNNISNYSINGLNVTDFKVQECTFIGSHGLNFTNGLRLQIIHNLFSTTFATLTTDALTLDLHYAENIEETSKCFLSGTNCVIKGNHFLGSIPSKINTISSLWVGNYPPETNNTNGIDTIDISLGDLIRPILTSGAMFSSFLGTAAIAFLETGTPSAATSPIHIGAKIDRTKGYNISISWTSAVFTGSVVWEVTAVFRERGSDPLASDFGTPTIKTVVSNRTNVTVRKEELATITFTESDYGYIAGVDPTHISFIIRRLGDDASDTLAGIAYITDITVSIPRD